MEESSRFAVPFIKCPSCRGYIRTGAWQPWMHSSVVDQWEDNADKLLSLRCIECDESISLRVKDQVDGKEHISHLGILTSGLSKSARSDLTRRWRQYSCGEVEAAEIFTVLASEDSDFAEPGEEPPSDELAKKLNA